MDELMDMMVDDASASQISDRIKDMLFAKSAERVDGYRPDAASSLFDQGETEDPEVEDTVSDEEEVVAAADGEI